MEGRLPPYLADGAHFFSLAATLSLLTTLDPNRDLYQYYQYIMNQIADMVGTFLHL